MKTGPEKILIATSNLGKVREICDLMSGLPLLFLSLNDVENPPVVVEDGATFEENALKKAGIVAGETALVTLADDSGLCVDALDGRPGVLSARYAGANASDEEKCARILAEMREVPDDKRSARFVCVLALVCPNGHEKIFRGVCEGRITHESKGRSGFGYDPIFFFEQAGKTFAEMSREEKNRVSHRGQALQALAAYLRELKDRRC